MSPESLIELLDIFRSRLQVPEQALLERLALAEARSALDVGCGTGAGAAAMAKLMPPGGTVAGVDASDAMIAEARRRTAAGGAGITFRVGDVLALPYGADVFDVCRAEAVLEHVADPARAVREMARVTRPGGRVGALEYDLGTMFLDHQDEPVTRRVLTAFRDGMAQPWIGRRLPRLFREAGLSGVSATPFAVLGGLGLFRAMLSPVVTRLVAERTLTGEQVSRWWSWLGEQDEAGGITGGVTMFAVTGTTPSSAG